MQLIVNTSPSTAPLTQRCDLRLDENGALSVTLAGDWLSADDVGLLRQTLANAIHFHGAFALRTDELGRLSGDAAALLAAWTQPERQTIGSNAAVSLSAS